MAPPLKHAPAAHFPYHGPVHQQFTPVTTGQYTLSEQLLWMITRTTYEKLKSNLFIKVIFSVEKYF